MSKYALGLDFGSLSARALLVEIGTGRELATATLEYAHAVMDTALPDGTRLGNPAWVDGIPAEGMSARIRHRSTPAPCRIERELPDGKWLVRFDEPVSAVTPGQSAVFYCGDTVVGGAYISSQRGINQWITA